jgi:hypothetical protein
MTSTSSDSQFSEALDALQQVSPKAGFSMPFPADARR